MGDPIGATQSFYSRGGGGGGGGGGGYKTQVGVRVLSGRGGGQRNVASFGFVFYKVGFPPSRPLFFHSMERGKRGVPSRSLGGRAALRPNTALIRGGSILNAVS